MERFLSVDDLARITGWRPFTIYKKSAAGQIPGRVKIGHSLRFKQSEIEAWLKAQAALSDAREDRGEHNERR